MATQPISTDDLKLAATCIRGLSMDGVQAANSGHPGMPMGMADVASVLFLKYLDHAPDDPAWIDRDRFVLSAGHGSMLLYSLLHLSGYNLSIDDLANFRQWNSRTPGHPEYGHTEGVETTTGPLGQGCANAAGMALAERMLAARFNTEGFTPIDHYTYAIAGDGDLMEGISHEAFSLAGHLKLNKLILFYDSNRITIEGNTELAYSDNVKRRFQGYKWNVLEIDAHDYDEIDKAIRRARRSKTAPTLVICRSHIAQGSPNMVDSHEAHGAPLGADEIAATKRNLGLPEDQTFYVPDRVRACFDAKRQKQKRRAARWNRRVKLHLADTPTAAAAWDAHMADALPPDLESYMPDFDVGSAVATRSASGKAIQGVAAAMPQLVGGSADLAPSNKSLIDGADSVGPDAYGGRNLHFGIREHAMGAMLNGMALHGGFRVYGATFFVFSDYFRPAIRLAALMKLPIIYILTHDSFYVGEDGPTHEPIEHLASLRCMPGLTLIRPADPTETTAAWVAALKNTNGPTALMLTRQNLPVLDRTVYPPASSVERGAYVLWQRDEGMPDAILLASGSEVSLALEAAQGLSERANLRVVSMPSLELFDAQDATYRENVLPAACTRRLAIEAGVTMGWDRYVGDSGRMLGVDHFGASAPCKILQKEYGFTVENVTAIVNDLLA